MNNLQTYMSNNNGYTTGNLLPYEYFSNDYKLNSLYFIVFRVSLFQGTHGWEVGGAKRSSFINICHVYPTNMNTGGYTLPKEDSKNI